MLILLNKFINKVFSPMLALGVLAILSACSITPDTIVRTPTTAKPSAIKPNAANSGAIFNASAYRPLFEDRRARLVGDILTINITENTNVTKAGGSSSSKTGSVDTSVKMPIGLPVKLIKEDISIGADSSIKNEDKAAANNNNVFNGSITVTVVEVLSNGNLVVSGEKQISLDKGNEYVRFSGVVNPDTVTVGNNVASTKVADARIEYRTNSKIDAAQIASILTRFFLSFAPL
ncbi:MAG TPA: flagellar basal body L-ring protein FlgH [Methylophilus sp.]|nr:flagellar basal body L-ring protein FlgH [Methylophilus sp.]HQQ32416.1 flagellar basal body L-ring protein FlgH [Methylophilus sp.]